MTNAEAIEILKRKIHDPVPKAAVGAKKENETIYMAISAMEKREQKKPLTNSDRIRALSDEELANAICDSIYYSVHPSTVEFMRFTQEHIMKIDYWLDYMRKEVNDNG